MTLVTFFMSVLFRVFSVLWQYYYIHSCHVSDNRSMRIVNMSRDFLQQFLHTLTLTYNKALHLLSGVFEDVVAVSFRRMMMLRFS